VITDTSNNVVWHWDNVSAFGANPATENGLTNYNLHFSGQYFDKESNLHYNNYRTYNPFLGRYMQSDPIGLVADVNTFRYAGNNSLSNFDNTGLDKFFMENRNSTNSNTKLMYQSFLADDNPSDTLIIYLHSNSIFMYVPLESGLPQMLGYNKSIKITSGRSLYNLLTRLRKFYPLLDLNKFKKFEFRTCNIGNSKIPQEFANIVKKPVLASKYFYGYKSDGSVRPMYSVGNDEDDEDTRWYPPALGGFTQPKMTTFNPE
jgi:RHS repeat-associated protein